jgi:hypothetical protein
MLAGWLIPAGRCVLMSRMVGIQKSLEVTGVSPILDADAIARA